ncbi:hypothetical protein M9H77_02648 [Catharanthus roseus]|uniref:Uncharacterized protein n=1 Tax=Catharanthus roseus TaxID=4058 RepID=A0ACC0C947_CATRO|nr:hypothetical protein M9H77_02648 [Catharanthus roseus]
MTQDAQGTIELLQGERFLDPTAGNRFHPTIANRVLVAKGLKKNDDGFNVIIMYGMKNYRRKYDEYHEGYDHGAHTHEGYDFRAYDRNDVMEGGGVANHHTFGFLEHKSYGFDGSLCSLLGDHCVKFQEEVVEHSQYVLTSFDTYVKNFVGKILVNNLLLVEKGLLEHSWHGLNFLLVEITFKTLFERAFGFKSFHVHYKEFLLWKEFQDQMSSYFRMSETNICDFLESNEVPFVLGMEDQRKRCGKEVLLSQVNSSISFLTNSSPPYLERYFKELKLFLNAYAFHEFIVETLCAIFRTCDACLIDVHLSICLSFHDYFWNQLLTRDAKLEQSCFDLKCWHDILDIISLVVDSFPSWTPGMIPNFLDSFDGKFLVKKVEGYLCSLIEDLLDKSIRRIVETYSYMISSFGTFVIALKGICLFKIHFLNVKVQLEEPCEDHKFLIGLEVLKAFLIENILIFQFYHISRSLCFY